MSEIKKEQDTTTDGYKPALCFGTFFILLCQSRKNLGSSKRNQFDTVKREVSETEIFNALMRIVFGDKNYAIPSNQVGRFKSCSTTQKIPCQNNKDALKSFNQSYDSYTGYTQLIHRVCTELLPLLNPEKDVILVKSLIALLHTAVCDENNTPLFDGNYEFQVMPDGKKESLWKLRNCIETISLPHFLLDIYRYILNNCKDNRIGRRTYEEWCPAKYNAKKGSIRPFTAGPDLNVVKSCFTVVNDCSDISRSEQQNIEKDPVEMPEDDFWDNKKLSPELFQTTTEKIKNIKQMSVIRELICDNTRLLTSDVCDFCLDTIDKSNWNELSILCKDLVRKERVKEPLFRNALRKLTKHSQSAVYDIFEMMYRANNEEFFNMFDEKPHYLFDNKLRTKFIAAYLPSVQEELAELPSDFESIIAECNYSLKASQNKVRVYSWDELDFKAVYVPPFLNTIPNQREESCNMNWVSDIKTWKSTTIIKKESEIPSPETIENDTRIKQEILTDTKKELSPSFTEEKKLTIVDQLNELLESLWKASLVDDLCRSTVRFPGLIDASDNEFADDFRTQSLGTRMARIGGIFDNDNIVYVVGGAGYGKSLFLKLLSVSPEIINGFDEKPRLIIRGDIKRLIRSDGTFKPMSEFIRECFVNGSLKSENEVKDDFLTKCLKAGRCLVLLDALDEVGNDQRTELHGLIISYFENDYPNNKVCITSRERGFIPFENITCYYITPIEKLHVEEYVDNFIRLGKFSPDEKERFVSQANVLVENGFVKGCLTLSLLLAIYKNEHELPTNKVLLYEKCFEYIATTREKNKKLMLNSSTGEPYDWTVLAKLMNDATFMELSQLGTPNNSDIPEYKVKELMLSLYEQRFEGSTECKMGTEMFLQFCSDRTEIFVPSPHSNLEYRFYHRSFYDYFFAKYIEARTNAVEATYGKLCMFDTGSEVIELLLTLYQRHNPLYLRELVAYAFSKVENFSNASMGNSFSKRFENLVLMMQVVDENDFIYRFIDLLLNENLEAEDLSVNIEFSIVAGVVKQRKNYLFEQFENNKEIYLNRIKKALVKSIKKNKDFYELMKKNSKYMSVCLDSVYSRRGYKFQWLLALFPDVKDILFDFFEEFADPKRLVFFRDIDKKTKADIMSFACKVKAMPLKEQERICFAILIDQN